MLWQIWQPHHKIIAYQVMSKDPHSTYLMFQPTQPAILSNYSRMSNNHMQHISSTVFDICNANSSNFEVHPAIT